MTAFVNRTRISDSLRDRAVRSCIAFLRAHRGASPWVSMRTDPSERVLMVMCKRKKLLRVSIKHHIFSIFLSFVSNSLIDGGGGTATRTLSQTLVCLFLVIACNLPLDQTPRPDPILEQLIFLAGMAWDGSPGSKNWILSYHSYNRISHAGQHIPSSNRSFPARETSGVAHRSSPFIFS